MFVCFTDIYTQALMCGVSPIRQLPSSSDPEKRSNTQVGADSMLGPCVNVIPARFKQWRSTRASYYTSDQLNEFMNKLQQVASV
jgi:hypothetical protein